MLVAQREFNAMRPGLTQILVDLVPAGATIIFCDTENVIDVIL